MKIKSAWSLAAIPSSEREGSVVGGSAKDFSKHRLLHNPPDLTPGKVLAYLLRKFHTAVEDQRNCLPVQAR
jgi:hypothetical protein